MSRRTKPQLPGDVLEELRRSAGFSYRRMFATMLPMSETTLWRMETVKWDTAPSDWQRKTDREDLVAVVQLAG